MTNLKPTIVLLISFILIACSFEIKKTNSDILVEKIAAHYAYPSDSSHDTIKAVLRQFSTHELSKNLKKAFWFNAYHALTRYTDQKNSEYLKPKKFLTKEFTVANKQMNTNQLIEQIKTYNDPRLLLCLDFYTTTSSPTYRHLLTKKIDDELDKLCSDIINKKEFVRVKSEAKKVYYPEHFDWHTPNSRALIIKYHKNLNLAKYEFKPYPFSLKLRNLTP